MILVPIKSEGLAHISYFLGKGSEAAVIDPRRDCQVYLDLAQQHEMSIGYIFETHRNEDYVIGSMELANLTDAQILHGHATPFLYGNKVHDGDRFDLGGMELRAIETPGHTVDSITYALSDRPGEDPVALFTGDTILVGDVGRTDLYGQGETARMAGLLFDSIFGRLLPLGDEVIVFPAHGEGTICGGHVSDRETTTLGIERAHDPALQNTTQERFVAYKVAEHHYTPPYFRRTEEYNLKGPPLLGRLPAPSALNVDTFREQMEAGAIVIDTRMPADFGGAHIPGSYSIWLAGLPNFAGWVLPYDQPLLLVGKDYAEAEQAVRYLVRLGYDWVVGYLRGGAMEWFDAAQPTRHLELLTVQELRERLLGRGGTLVLDVRSDAEWQEGHI